jgi:hypothetical protein
LQWLLLAEWGMLVYADEQLSALSGHVSNGCMLVNWGYVARAMISVMLPSYTYFLGFSKI